MTIARTSVLCTASLIIVLNSASSGLARSPIEIFYSAGPYSFQFTPDSRFLVRGYLEGYVDSWKIEEQRTEGTPLHTGHEVLAIAFSEKGRIVALKIDENSADKMERVVKLYSWPDKKLLVRYEHMSPADVEFSRDGSLLMMKPVGKNITLYEIVAGRIPKRVGEVDGTTANRYASLSPDGKMVAYLTKDNCISVWDMSKSEVRRTVCPIRQKNHSDAAPPVARRLPVTNYTNDMIFTTDGKYLVTRSIESEPDLVRMCFWDTVHWERVRSVTYRDRSGGALMAIACSPDAKFIAVSDYTLPDSTQKATKATSGTPIALIDVETGRLKCWCRCKSFSSVTRFVFSPNGNYLAAWMGDAYLRIWNMSDVMKEADDVLSKDPSIGKRSQ